MTERERRLQRLRAVQREFETAAVAIDALGARFKVDPSALASYGLTKRDFHKLQQNLEATYLVRLFAEFETTLRSAWTHAFHRVSHPRITDLHNSIAARRSIPERWLDAVHEVRVYRNSIVHEDSDKASPVAIPDACNRLCRFLSQLPARW